MATTTARPHTPGVSRPGPLPVTEERPVAAAPAAISVWAAIGAVIVLFEAYVIVRWVTGPYFRHVPSGTDEPSSLMKAVLIFWQAIPIPVTSVMVWRLVVRPWRRERRIGVDGMFTLAFLTIWFQDPISNYGGTWIAYNSHTLNWGSWTTSIPGWLSYSKPGHMLAEPLLFTPPAYAPLFLLGSVVGCWGLRYGHRRWPGSLARMLVCCVAGVAVFDLVVEALLWLPGGLYEYPGGHWAVLFPSHYFAFPLTDMLAVTALFTGLACLRFFLDDRGQTRAERGAERLRLSPGRRTVLRVLAVTGATQAIFLLTYNVPMGFINGMHPAAWPKDLQQRSYFRGGMCGEGTTRACPPPTVIPSSS